MSKPEDCPELTGGKRDTLHAACQECSEGSCGDIPPRLDTDTAFVISKEIEDFQAQGRQMGTALLLEIGYRLNRIEEGRGWEALGYDSMEAYAIDRHDIHIKRVRQLQQVARQHYLTYLAEPSRIKMIEHNRLRDISPLIEKGTPVEDLLLKATHSSNKDWQNWVREVKGKPATDTCDHEEVVTVTKCARCGKVLP